LCAILAHIDAQAAEIARLREAIKTQASAVRTLQANEQTEINILRKQRNEWHHAVSSLDSEREANALLTAEIERLQKRLTQAIERLRDMLQGDDGQAWGEAQRFVDIIAQETQS
jgi:chromosome segregation ATPase